ncbi:MAG: class I SAM-dependent methyltransferase [Usitatibacter sp.]
MAVTSPPQLVADEVALLGGLVPLAGAAVVDLGCGNGDFARKLVAQGMARSVDALEVDLIQHARNVNGAQSPQVTFAAGGAEAIALPDGSRDLVVMMKSLHHVPMFLQDQALGEVRRVLRPGGHLYVSEPVFAGEFNEVVRLFHDEGEVRAAAYAAIQRAIAAGILLPVLEQEFMAPLAFRDYDDFHERIVKATHSEHVLTPELERTVRERFEAHMTPAGARFSRPMRVNLLQR